MSGHDLGIENLADVEEIGQGGFSVVYAATDTQFDRRVAVKVLGRLTKDSDRRRFDAECRIMGRLSAHPNVATVHSAGHTNDGRPYLIMELFEGGTLADRLAASGRLPWQQVLDVIRPIADALGDAHTAGILHRDIKPENILMAGDEPSLTDFGIAYLRDATGATSTQITASWHHTAPETFSSTRDERSDLYSLASAAYTLIAGAPPFWRAEDDSLNPLMYRLLHEPPPTLAPNVAPSDVDAFLQRCLAKDPNHRPQTAAAFIAELDTVRALGAAGTVAAVPVVPDVSDVSDVSDVDATRPILSGTDPTDPTRLTGPSGPTGQSGWDAVSEQAAAGSGRPRQSLWTVALPVAIVLAMVIAGVFVFAFDNEPASASELVLEPISSVGQDPFTDPIVPGAPGGPSAAAGGQASEILDAINTEEGSLPATDFSGVQLPEQAGGGDGGGADGGDGGGTINVAGSAEGLYGGSNELAVCDRQALVEFLTADEAKGDAWASVLGITRAEIPSYIDGLTDVVLQVDTRVTNHGFIDGEAVPVDSILQAGTAVLIDEYGVPRVRCYCGNPLLEARPFATDQPAVTGPGWTGFDVASAIIVSPVDPVSEFVLDDMLSDDFLLRAPGSDATDAELINADESLPGSTTTTSRDTSTSTESPTATTDRTTTPAFTGTTLDGTRTTSTTDGGRRTTPSVETTPPSDTTDTSDDTRTTPTTGTVTVTGNPTLTINPTFTFVPTFTIRPTFSPTTIGGPD